MMPTKRFHEFWHQLQCSVLASQMNACSLSPLCETRCLFCFVLFCVPKTHLKELLVFNTPLLLTVILLNATLHFLKALRSKLLQLALQILDLPPALILYKSAKTS